MASFQDCSIKFPKGAQDNQLDLKNPILFLDEKSETFYAYGDGSVIYKSKDLLQWSAIQLEGVSFSHPCISKYKHEYRIYSTTEDAIVLYTGFSPEGPFEYRCVVLKSQPELEFFADCPSVAVDAKTEQQYLICGKNGSGVFAIPLDVSTGLLMAKSTPICLARRPKWMSSAVSEGFIVYHPTTKYYYLFVTYGQQGCDSNIRVARSKNITGPYADSNGKSLLDLDDFQCNIGQMCLSGYQFNQSFGYISPSRPSIVKTAKNSWYISHSINPVDENDKPKEALMQIREIKWSSTGWPLLSPCVFAGEHTQQMQKEWLIGDYEFIKFKPTVPQEVCYYVVLHLLAPMDEDPNTQKDAWAYAVPKDSMGRVNLGESIRGSWRLINETTLEITYWNYIETYRILPAWDTQLNCETIILTGKDSNGYACMAKKY